MLEADPAESLDAPEPAPVLDAAELLDVPPLDELPMPEHVLMLKKTDVVPPSRVVAGPPPPPIPSQTPPSGQDMPTALAGQYGAPTNWHIAQSLGVPVPLLPPELLAALPPLVPLLEPPASIALAHPPE